MSEGWGLGAAAPRAGRNARRAAGVRRVTQLRQGARLALLALLTSLPLLAACEEEGVRPTVTMTAADSADQILYGMEHLITTAGVRRTKVVADTAYLYEATQLARLKVVTVTFYDALGEHSSTVTADSGTYEMRDGSMRAWGDVLASTPDGRKLQSQELIYDSRQHKISSDLPFTYDRGDQHLEGNGFTSDPDFRNVVTRQPRGGQRGTPANPNGGVLLPGQ